MGNTCHTARTESSSRAPIFSKTRDTRTRTSDGRATGLIEVAYCAKYKNLERKPPSKRMQGHRRARQTTHKAHRSPPHAHAPSNSKQLTRV